MSRRFIFVTYRLTFMSRRLVFVICRVMFMSCRIIFVMHTQALHGLAPKCELINVHELIKKSTNNYVTLLPLENGINLNTKG